MIGAKEVILRNMLIKDEKAWQLLRDGGHWKNYGWGCLAKGMVFDKDVPLKQIRGWYDRQDARPEESPEGGKLMEVTITKSFRFGKVVEEV